MRLLSCALHKLVNVLLPGVKAVIVNAACEAYRRAHKVRELVVSQASPLVIQIAVPLLKVLHGSFQRFSLMSSCAVNVLNCASACLGCCAPSPSAP